MRIWLATLVACGVYANSKVTSTEEPKAYAAHHHPSIHFTVVFQGSLQQSVTQLLLIENGIDIISKPDMVGIEADKGASGVSHPGSVSLGDIVDDEAPTIVEVHTTRLTTELVTLDAVLNNFQTVKADDSSQLSLGEGPTVEKTVDFGKLEDLMMVQNDQDKGKARVTIGCLHA